MSLSARIKALDEGRGIQYLLDAAYAVLQNPIAMFDTPYSLKAYTDVASDDPLWIELITTGTFSMETQQFFASERFTEAVANADRLAILKSPKLSYDRISCGIFNGEGIWVSNLVVVASNKPFGDEDPEAIEALAEKMSRVASNDVFYYTYGRSFHQSIIRDLLDGVIQDPVLYAPRVQILYDDFDDYLYVAVVDVPQSDNHQRALEQFCSLLTSAYPSFKFAVYATYIVMIMSSKLRFFDEKLFFDIPSNPFKLNNLFVGISSSFENLYTLREHYDKAVAALIEGKASDSSQRVFHSE